jgi:iron donor protein CyaY
MLSSPAFHNGYYGAVVAEISQQGDKTMTMLSEQEFRLKADEALEQLRRALIPLADAEDFEIDLQNGVLNLVFEKPTETKFVVSPNAPVRQMWVSAMAKGYKLSWSPELSAFVLDGETLAAMLERLARTFLGA